MTRKFKHSIVALWSPILCNQPVDWEIEDRKSIFFKISSADDVKMSQFECSHQSGIELVHHLFVKTPMLCPLPGGNMNFVDIGGGPPKMAYSKGKSLIFSYFLWSRKVCRKIQDISWVFSLIHKILCGIKTYGTLRSIPHTYFCEHPISRLRGDRATMRVKHSEPTLVIMIVVKLCITWLLLFYTLC